jgi:hypothetical protein
MVLSKHWESIGVLDASASAAVTEFQSPLTAPAASLLQTVASRTPKDQLIGGV